MAFGLLISFGLVLLTLPSFSLGYKHVVFMHGLMAGPEEWPYFESLIQKYHPGTPITKINLFNKLETLAPMWTQVDGIAKQVAPILQNKSSEGTILICFSQGGLICRGLLSILDHNVETFISLSAPLAGQFGDTSYLAALFPKYMRDSLYKLFYTPLGQIISIANYWYDPHHVNLFYKFSDYLGRINNQTFHYNLNMNRWRSNFLKLNNLVLVGGPDDGVITPWQSSQFGMYNNKTDVMPMEKQQFYLDDSFGLRSLKKRGAIHLKTISGIKHIHWHTTPKVFEICIKPWLS